MNKLQLYITKSFDGYKGLFNINPSPEVSGSVREIADIVTKVSYDASEKNIFYYVTSVESGIFVVIVRTIPNDVPDHLAAWIFVPNALIISGEQLTAVVNGVTRRISSERVTKDDVDFLRELFAQEYHEDSDVAHLTASNTAVGVAWRKYGEKAGVSLADLFGKGLFQVPYLDYNGIVFVDEELGITVDGADITDLPLEDPATILPVQKSAQNFAAYVFGNLLDRPFRATMNANVAFVWKCPGFGDVVNPQVINAAEFEPAVPDTSKSCKTISASSFQIVSRNSEINPRDCEITVNGIDVSENPHRFTADELTSALVTIVCEGYAPHNGRLDLAAATRALVRLHERTKVYCFEMPVKHTDLGAPVRFKIYSKKELTESPIEGYVALSNHIDDGESRTNHLAYSPVGASTTQKIIYVAVGIVAGFIFGLLTRCGGNDVEVVTETPDNPEQVAQTSAPAPATPAPAVVAPTSPTPATPAPAPVPQAAAPQASVAKTQNSNPTPETFKYLDNNNRWTKDVLESQPGLQGLYDDMINYRLDVIITKWGPKLKGSKNFSRIVDHAQKGNTAAKRAKSGIDRTTYPGGAEQRINIIDYLNKIDP